MGDETIISGICLELRDAVDALISECQTRFVLEVAASDSDRVVSQLHAAEAKAPDMGQVTTTQHLKITGSTGATLIDAGRAELKTSWQAPLKW